MFSPEFLRHFRETFWKRNRLPDLGREEHFIYEHDPYQFIILKENLFSIPHAYKIPFPAGPYIQTGLLTHLALRMDLRARERPFIPVSEWAMYEYVDFLSGLDREVECGADLKGIVADELELAAPGFRNVLFPKRQFLPLPQVMGMADVIIPQRITRLRRRS